MRTNEALTGLLREALSRLEDHHIGPSLQKDIRAALASAPPAVEPVAWWRAQKPYLPDFFPGARQPHLDGEPDGKYQPLYAAPQPAEPAQPATQAGAGEKRWPFVLSPSLIAGLLYEAMREFDGDMVAVVRNVFIEQAIDLRPTEQPSQDAERYRWLRAEVDARRLTVAKGGFTGLEPWSGDDLDGRIDAAHAHGEKGSV